MIAQSSHTAQVDRVDPARSVAAWRDQLATGLLFIGGR